MFQRPRWAHVKCRPSRAPPVGSKPLWVHLLLCPTFRIMGKERKLLKESKYSSPYKRGSNYRVNSGWVFPRRSCLWGWFVPCVWLGNASLVCQAWNRRAGALPQARLTRRPCLCIRCVPMPGPQGWAWSLGPPAPGEPVRAKSNRGGTAAPSLPQ